MKNKCEYCGSGGQRYLSDIFVGTKYAAVGLVELIFGIILLSVIIYFMVKGIV
jgi:hypothetical protein